MSILTDEQKQKRTEFSRFKARKWQSFIAEHCKRGHTNTVARAVTIAGLELRDSLDKERFDRGEFMLEIDRILIELEISGEWFWRDR
jgi:hypothetical protein